MAPNARGRPGHSDAEKAARVKALLSNYYGADGGDEDGAEQDSLAALQQQPRPQQRNAPEPAASAALTDLDSNEFSVDRCRHCASHNTLEQQLRGYLAPCLRQGCRVLQAQCGACLCIAPQHLQADSSLVYASFLPLRRCCNFWAGHFVDDMAIRVNLQQPFVVHRYLATLLRDARLDKLLSSSTTMSLDIKSLDADMQRLVRRGSQCEFIALKISPHCRPLVAQSGGYSRLWRSPMCK